MTFGIDNIHDVDMQVALHYRTWNTKTYAVVLFYKGMYYGHIYAWISPVDPTKCFAIGIRARTDAVFLQDTLRNTSHYLLEGVRLFAKAKGCTSITIPSPLIVMQGILPKLGFKTDYPIHRDNLIKTLGQGYIGRTEDETCENCYTNDNISYPFVTLTGELIE